MLARRRNPISILSWDNSYTHSPQKSCSQQSIPQSAGRSRHMLNTSNGPNLCWGSGAAFSGGGAISGAISLGGWLAGGITRTILSPSILAIRSPFLRRMFRMRDGAFSSGGAFYRQQIPNSDSCSSLEMSCNNNINQSMGFSKFNALLPMVHWNLRLDWSCKCSLQWTFKTQNECPLSMDITRVFINTYQ